MIPNPIRKVLSTFQTHQVQALLMGGQACVFYGAAEFSRDTDFVLLANPENLARLQSALDDLVAERIAVPPFDPQYLLRGHAVHFRCRHPEAAGLRVDVMSKMRGVADFPRLWERRTTLTDARTGEITELLALPDLVQAKKTQRDKDWPMIRRLVEANYHAFSFQPTEEQLDFWLLQARTPEILLAACSSCRSRAESLASSRPLLVGALRNEIESVVSALEEEEKHERKVDAAYWRPLRAELEHLRHGRRFS